MRRVAVVGGGISGLAAAWELTGGAVGPEAGATGEGDPTQVMVLESSPRLGGALHSVPFGGRMIDTGPDAFLGRRPEALTLCHEIGLEDALVPIARGGAGVWARGKVRPLPEGLALGIPIRFWPVARSGILGRRGNVALVRDVVAPRPNARGPIGDRAIGPLVSRKLGRRVTDRLVDPLIGGIHAGSVDDMSAAATYPPLLAASEKRGGLMRALRSEIPTPSENPPPAFWAIEGGMSVLIEGLRAALVARGVEFRCNAPVDRLERLEPKAGRSARWSVRTSGPDAGENEQGQSSEVDAVVLAVPAPVAARLLRPHDDESAGLLANIAYATVNLVTFRLRADAVPSPLAGTGFLVPRHSPAARGQESWAVTACTYLSQKWPHVATEGDVLLRASVGRFGDVRPDAWSDEELADRAWRELGLLIGPLGDPLESMVARWPGAFPQYRVHHLMRTAGIEAAVARLGGIAVAGAAYRGVGIPACIASGRTAARAVS